MNQPVNYWLLRVGLSLPCAIPVVPGTPNTDADDEAKTEVCSTDAWWNMNGRVPICDRHLRVALELMGDKYEKAVAEFVRENPRWRGKIPNETETKPWTEQHRYEPFARSANETDDFGTKEKGR